MLVLFLLKERNSLKIFYEKRYFLAWGQMFVRLRPVKRYASSFKNPEMKKAGIPCLSVIIAAFYLMFIWRRCDF